MSGGYILTLKCLCFSQTCVKVLSTSLHKCSDRTHTSRAAGGVFITVSVELCCLWVGVCSGPTRASLSITKRQAVSKWLLRIMLAPKWMNAECVCEYRRAYFFVTVLTVMVPKLV